MASTEPPVDLVRYRDALLSSAADALADLAAEQHRAAPSRHLLGWYEGRAEGQARAVFLLGLYAGRPEWRLADTDDALDLARKRLATRGASGATERPAEPGELCTCGRPATLVYLGGALGPTGYCGRSDGGDKAGPCPFCGAARHEGRCASYRLRLDDPAEGSAPR